MRLSLLCFCALPLGLALLGPSAASALVQDSRAEAPLPRDRQLLEQRYLGHLSPVAGERCIPRRRVTQLIVLSDTRLLLRVGRNLVYEAQLNPGCEGLTQSPYQPSFGHGRSTLCAGDTVELVDAGSSTSCTISAFRIWQPAATGVSPR